MANGYLIIQERQRIFLSGKILLDKLCFRKSLYPVDTVLTLSLNFCYLFSVCGRGVWFACMAIHHVCAWESEEAREGFGSSGSGATGGCELPCGCGELNLGSL